MRLTRGNGYMEQYNHCSTMLFGLNFLKFEIFQLSFGSISLPLGFKKFNSLQLPTQRGQE
jgi:hypothetical protein